MSGGQHSLQVPGYLTLQNDATPPLVTERDHSVREVFAVLGEAPVGGPVRLRVKADGQLWCELLIPEGQTASESQDGFGLPALPIGTEMNVDIVTIPQSGSSKPGKDLTVVIRL
mgnify:CR=1 FL=1